MASSARTTDLYKAARDRLETSAEPLHKIQLVTVVDDPPLKLVYRICWAEYGDPAGEPVMLLRGGPGGGCTNESWVTRIFDPERLA